MKPADRPATPDEDMVARREWRGPTLAGDVLTPELVAFCQTGLSIILGSCADGVPIAGRGYACRIDPAGTVRILVRQAGHAEMLAALRAGAALAATFSDPLDHRSIQIKASSALVIPATVADGMALAVQCESFRDRMVAVGYTPALSNAVCLVNPTDIIAVDFLPDIAYVQTPGPGAGSALAP